MLQARRRQIFSKRYCYPPGRRQGEGKNAGIAFRPGEFFSESGTLAPGFVKRLNICFLAGFGRFI